MNNCEHCQEPISKDELSVNPPFGNVQYWHSACLKTVARANSLTIWRQDGKRYLLLGNIGLPNGSIPTNYHVLPILDKHDHTLAWEVKPWEEVKDHIIQTYTKEELEAELRKR